MELKLEITQDLPYQDNKLSLPYEYLDQTGTLGHNKHSVSIAKVISKDFLMAGSRIAICHIVLIILK